jgi:hypothetical protein
MIIPAPEAKGPEKYGTGIINQLAFIDFQLLQVWSHDEYHPDSFLGQVRIHYPSFMYTSSEREAS